MSDYQSSRIWGWPYAEKLVSEAWIGKVKEDSESQGTDNPKPAVNKGDPSATDRNQEEIKDDTWKQYIDDTKSWLANEAVNFVTLYLDAPGKKAEIFGPNSSEAIESVKTVDRFIGELAEAVDTAKVNLMVVTTPGFVTVTNTHNSIINLENYGKKGTYSEIGSSPFLGVQPTGEGLHIRVEVAKVFDGFFFQIKLLFTKASNRAKMTPTLSCIRDVISLKNGTSRTPPSCR